MRFVAFLLALLAITAFSQEDPMRARPAHHGPKAFFNPGYPWHEPPVSVTAPFFLRRFATSLMGAKAGTPDRVANDGAFLRQNALGSVPSVTWIGHSTVLVQMGHVTFLTDPIWSRTASPLPIGPRRYVAPGLALEDLPHVDFVVVSHNHYDHMDLETLHCLARRGTRFFVPLGNARLLEREGIGPVEELDWWDSRTLGEVTIHSVPARHWSRRGVSDLNQALWSGWVVHASDRRFYFAGDTGSFSGFEEIGARLGPFDLAALPIGAYSPSAMMAPSHLDPEQAISAAESLAAKRSIAIHFGTFDLSDEPLDEPPRRFRAASARAGRGDAVDWVLKVGETRLW